MSAKDSLPIAPEQPSAPGLAGLAALIKGKSAKDGYRDIVTHTLAGFQLLEEGLKKYIDSHYGAIRILVKGRVHFAFDRKDIDQAPLGKLCNIFAKVCANQDLVKRLRALIKHRDEIAHRALTHLYGSNTSDAELQAMWDEYVEVSNQVSDALTDVHAELLNLGPIFNGK
jgi:hypothetical protein